MDMKKIFRKIVMLCLTFALLLPLFTKGANAATTISTMSKKCYTNKLDRKVKWCLIGDSISDHRQYPEGTKLYMDYINDEGNVDLTNLAFWGTGFMTHVLVRHSPSSENYQHDLRVLKMPADTEILTVFSSFNDVAILDKIPYSIGSLADTSHETLCGSMNLFLRRAKTINPNVKIGIVTPLKWVTYELDEVKKLQCIQYANAVKTWAFHNDIPVLDLYYDKDTMGFDLMDFNNYQNHDGTHILPSVHEGYMYPRVAEFLNELYTRKPKDDGLLVKEIALNPNYEFYANSVINTGTSTLFTNTYGAHKNIVVAVNAGHGTEGGASKKTLSHPDGSPKLSGGSTPAGSVESIAVSSGMVFNDGVSESEITLKLANRVMYELLHEGYSVLMIRSRDDVQLDNVGRTIMANNNANIHVSLHYDSTQTDKGAFYIGAINNEAYTSMYPVSKHYQKSEVLGKSIINCLKNNGNKIYQDGRMGLDLTQISYSTIPTVDLELGDKASDHSDERLVQLAKHITLGIDTYLKNYYVR